MKNVETHSNGGFWMLVGLIALLSAPLLAGHLLLKPASSDTKDMAVITQLAPASN